MDSYKTLIADISLKMAFASVTAPHSNYNYAVRSKNKQAIVKIKIITAEVT